MSSIKTGATARVIASAERVAENPFGYFTADGSEYVITNPRTPRPWSNIISNPRAGLAISQTGSGFSWVDNSQLAVLTRWQQEFAQDSSGKFLYVRDADSGEIWSLAPAPCWPSYDEYTCTHGLGYTTFATRCGGIEARWTLFVDAEETVEGWLIELINHSGSLRRLELCAYLEWNCGVLPSPRREFHKLFLENQFDAKRRAIVATSHMWDVPSRDFGHWNTSFPYHTALACTAPILSAQGDKEAFLGAYGDFRAPTALAQDTWRPVFGRHDDAVAALRSAVELKPGQAQQIGYVLATGRSRRELEELLTRFNRVDALEQSLASARAEWRTRLATGRVATPDTPLNFLANDWVRYQTISGRIWGRAGYYQQSGAFGFRDQLQDSQVWLTLDPARCRSQLNLHAAHQFADGSVYHWWHPLSEQGHITRMTDDLLWLAFVTANYIRETGDLSVLGDRQPYLDDRAEYPLLDHIQRAFERVFQRTSDRGIPFIGAGDWNDGLSACGLQERGESFWLGQFLAGLLAEWAEIFGRLSKADAALRAALTGGDGQAARWEAAAQSFLERREGLVKALNAHAWDGGWYARGTLDDGSVFGSRQNSRGRIFLNAQTWAILSDVAPPERAQLAWNAVRQHLISPAGALLLAPAYDQPIEQIGYITRYAPGLRENGGVYSHAATWAIAAACRMRDAETVERLLSAMNPIQKDPRRYWAEPYVLPGNVDGPDSPHHGRAGWTWYTGSAQWFQRVLTHFVLGVRPEFDGLRIDPVMPASWPEARLVRQWRGCTYEIHIRRAAKGTAAAPVVHVDGQRLSDNLIPIPSAGGATYRVTVDA